MKKISIKPIFISIILAFIGVYGFFTTPVDLLNGFLKKYGFDHEDWAKAILVVISFIFIYLVITLINCILKKTKTLLINIDTFPRAHWASDASGERIHDFQSLRVQAKESIYVMGIGATYFSSDLSLLDRLLDRDLKIRILIMEPLVIADSSQKDFSKGVKIVKDSFNDYFARPEYDSDVKSSYLRLKTYIEKKIQEGYQSKIKLRSYNAFMPLNFTAIDESKKGKILLEFCLPFSDQRLRMHFSRRYHKDVYNKLYNITEDIWNKSHPVIDCEVPEN